LAENKKIWGKPQTPKKRFNGTLKHSLLVSVTTVVTEASEHSSTATKERFD